MDSRYVHVHLQPESHVSHHMHDLVVRALGVYMSMLRDADSVSWECGIRQSEAGTIVLCFCFWEDVA